MSRKVDLIAHPARVQGRKTHKKSVDPFLPIPGNLGSPTPKDKSKAHAVWREHFAYFSFWRSLIEISQVSSVRTIAKCYVRILKYVVNLNVVCFYSSSFLFAKYPILFFGVFFKLVISVSAW